MKSVNEVSPGLGLLRHTLATLAYRGAKAVRGDGSGFAGFRAAPGTRTPAEILAHVGDLLDWALALADGQHIWHDSSPLDWDDEVSRFFRAMETFEARLASGKPVGCTPEKLFQGPIADALTHIGQISMLRRMAGHPVRGENYYRAHIAAGVVGAEQPAPLQEFD